MATKRILAVFLAVVVGQHAAGAQTSPTSGNAKGPAAITIRDNQGKMVPVPPGNPAQPVNYIQWINETLSKGITDNAADVYGESYTLYKDVELEDEELDKAMAGPWADLPTVSAWLAANRASLDKFRQATLKPQCYFRLEAPQFSGVNDAWDALKAEPRTSGWLVGVLFPGLGTHRSLCKGLIAEGWQAWKQGKEDRIVENAATVLRSSHHVGNQMPLIHHLVGTSVAIFAYDALRTAMSLSRDPDAFAGRVAGKLGAAVDPPTDPSESRCLAFEFIAFRDTCQRMFIPGKKPGTWQVSKAMVAAVLPVGIDDKGLTKGFADADKQLAHIGYDATLAECDEMVKRIQAWLAKPCPEAVKDSKDIETAIQKSQNPLIKVMLLDLPRFRTLDARRTAHRRGVHLIAQLYVYHAKNHAFPEKLDELKATNLKEIRVDPFSGKDFVYKKQGEGFLLYSVGEDLKDDGGKHNKSWKQGDFVFWPVQTDSQTKQ